MFGTHDRYTRLKDGTLAHLRDIRATDAVLVRDGFSRMSDESRYARFFYPIRELTTDQLRYFTQVDGRDHVAVVALSADETVGLGTARFIRDADDPKSAEFAVTIPDDAQGQGLGAALLDLLTEEAREVGVEYFVAQVHATNLKIRGLLKKVRAEWVGSDGSVARYRWRI